jgi:hypothetical protein
MFCANDPLCHDVYWSALGGRWTVENERDGVVGQYDMLCTALTQMHIRTAKSFVDDPDCSYAEVVTKYWTMAENPY